MPTSKKETVALKLLVLYLLIFVTSAYIPNLGPLQGDRRKLSLSNCLFLPQESTILSIVGTKISLVLGHFGIWI